MKKYLILVLVFVLCAIPIVSNGQSTEHIWITVSVSASADIAVPNIGTVSNWFITNVSFSFATNSPGVAIVSNAGAANEIFQLAVNSLGSGWTNSISASEGLNTYVIQGIFNSLSDAQATNSDFDGSDVITAYASNATGSKFGNALWSTNGTNVAPGDKRNLSIRFVVPSSGLASPAKPTCQLVISATLK